MGIHGIYKEIGTGRRVALSKFSVEHYERHSRPLRLAIDISIWLFQIQSGKGGSNPALRTFYYRLLRLLSLNIHPLFVFDGPNKPTFKRNKRVGGPHVKVSSVPEFLAKQLLKQFGFPMHLAPGEAEAECALLQREGIVDAVLSEDVDTLMFGSRITMRSWTPEAKSSKTPTHVNVYDAQVTKDSSNMDREGMILVALMSGGDYIPEGIPGCGPKTACEAAKAGFGAQLCKLKRRDEAGFKEWRERLQHELWTNEHKLFRTRRRIEIPEGFPNREVLGYYTHPVVSGAEKLASLRQTLRWDMPIDFPALRSFTADAFDWVCISGAKKFIRNLAPAILTRELRLRAEQGANDGGDLVVQEAAEERLVIAIHGRREHASTDNTPEIRISFLPLNMINIDLSIEPPDEEVVRQVADDSDSDAPLNDDVEIESVAPASPRKRGPSKYNPEELEKIWILDTFLRQGVPLKVQDWEASHKDAKKYMAAKRAAKEATKKKKASGGMCKGALDPFTKVVKPGVARSKMSKPSTPDLDTLDLTTMGRPASTRRDSTESSAAPSTQPGFRMPILNSADFIDLGKTISSQPLPQPRRATKRPSPDPVSPRPHYRSKSETPKSARLRQPTIIDLLSPSQTPTRKGTPSTQRVNRIIDFGPDGAKAAEAEALLFLPDTVTKRRKRSPFKRVETAPAALGDGYPSPLLLNPSDLDDLDLPLPSIIGVHGGVETSAVADADGRTKGIEEIIILSDTPEPPSPSRTPAEVKEPIFAPFARPPAATAEKKPPKTKKKFYQLRESLDGAWKEVEVEVEEEDLTLTKHGASIMSSFTRSSGSQTRGNTRPVDRTDHQGKRWRFSEVSVLDLTED
ncbi:hypothetical protein K461DRAFT_245940 [Myriangium duriaei CBS 260.36]|uniref:XPG-I domain-containing protein n=1 Tax=Myriangium duriaei CBS 260.36 TaxID=1168546 RepID=A0A9P4ISM4_9PEZI|nr:hypothetical protein K461DRAFT_245940 [Myriangium duriaei CBS 260.36]